MPSNYPGPSLGMSFVNHSHSFGSTSHRRSSSTLAYAETIHESSSEDEVEHQQARRAKDLNSVFDTLGSGSPLPAPTLVSPMPRYPTGLGISDARRPPNQRRSLPPSTSTSPMQNATPAPSSYSSTSMKSFRRRSSGQHSPFANGALSTSPASASPSPFSSSFVGSYEQSLLSGRMANKPSNAATPLPFTASLGVLGLGKNTPRALKCPDHVSIPFGAYFWDMDSSDKKGKGSPYVGTLDLTEHYLSMLEKRPSDSTTDLQTDFQGSQSTTVPRFPGYRVPPKGQIQVVIKNANQTAVKLFLVPYDLSDMPPGSKTFVRQKSYDIESNNPATSPTLTPTTSRTKETLRYAIHLHFCAVPAKEKDRGRKKGSHATRRTPGLHHGHHHPSHQPYSQEHRPMSPARQLRNAESPVRPASPHTEETQRRPRSNSSTASHIYLYKSIRVAFTSRALDLSEKLKTVHEGPSGLQTAPSSKDPPALNADGPLDKDKYSSYSGPGEAWEEAKKARIHADKAHERHVAQMQKLQLHFDDPVPFDPNGELITPGKEHGHSTYVPGHIASVRRRGFALLNTPPVEAALREDTYSHARGRSDTLESDNLMEAAEVTEPLSFQRSPIARNVPLPSLLESGLSISRPGSRTHFRTASPEKSTFGSVVPKEALR